MPSENIFIAHPTTLDQINALKAVVKALNVKFEVRKSDTFIGDSEEKDRILKSISEGFRDMHLIQAGKTKGTSMKEFLDEL